jgi:NADH:ubiquinone oxidoreductase subunit 3 (subunit A)
MVGAIILTAEHNKHTRVITIEKPSPFILDDDNFYSYNLDLIIPKKSNILMPFILLSQFIYYFIISNHNIYMKNKRVIFKKLFFSINTFLYMLFFKNFNIIKNFICLGKYNHLFNSIFIQKIKLNTLRLSGIGVYPFFNILNSDSNYSEGLVGTLIYYIISNIIIGLLLLFINSTFSISVKYLEKGGGFECGFTSFFQTRERYNIIFYRVSLLFLIFDLEIILAFPYPAIYQKNQNMSKNNVLAFLYILVVGFIYELKEGALNVVKTPHHSDIHVKS